MSINDRNRHSGAPSIFATGEVDQALRKGRELRAAAMRHAFSRLRPSLSPTELTS